jgi:hypothetical protein
VECFTRRMSGVRVPHRPFIHVIRSLVWGVPAAFLGSSGVETEAVTIMEPRIIDPRRGSLPTSCRGPDGKLRQMTEEEHRQYIESALRRIDEIEQIPDNPGDPPEEEWMRGIDALRPHRPLFKDYY